MIKQCAMLVVMLTFGDLWCSLRTEVPSPTTTLTDEVDKLQSKDSVGISLQEMSERIRLIGTIDFIWILESDRMGFVVEEGTKKLYLLYAKGTYVCWLLLNKESPSTFSLSQDDAAHLFQHLYKKRLLCMSKWGRDALREQDSQALSIKVSVATQTDLTQADIKEEAKLVAASASSS
jgi:hypothetical protein